MSDREPTAGTIDGAAPAVGVIAGSVFRDLAGTGVRGSGDRGVPGIGVELRAGGDSRRTETDADGRFRFDQVPAGRHVVRVDVAGLPPNLVPTGDIRRTVHIEGDDARLIDFGLLPVTPLLDQLPGAIARDEFLQRFVGLFEELTAGVGDHANGLGLLPDPTVTPLPMVHWLGHWLGIPIEPEPRRLRSRPEPRRADRERATRELHQRRIVQAAAYLFHARGTRAGLWALLAVLTQGEVRVADGCRVYSEDQAPRNTRHVRIELETAGAYAVERVQQFIEGELPANLSYELWVGDSLAYDGRTAAAGRDA